LIIVISIAGGGEEDEERWLELELELLERMSVRTQTVEEILAEVIRHERAEKIPTYIGKTQRRISSRHERAEKIL
jgi:hypothetical protein